jgi:Fe-S-cluster containining protein
MSEGCRSCTGRCCYDVVVHVTPFDVRRIGQAQGLAPDDIVEAREVDDHEGSASAIFGIAAGPSPRKVRPVLRKSSAVPDACQFLIHVTDEHKRCGIYAERPRVCAVYPFAINRGSVDLRDDVRCGPDDWNLARLDYGAIRRELAVFNAEWHATARMVEAWNDAVGRGERPPSFEAFIAYGDAIAGHVLNRTDLEAEPFQRWDEAGLSPKVEDERRGWLDSVSVLAHAELAAAKR